MAFPATPNNCYVLDIKRHHSSYVAPGRSKEVQDHRSHCVHILMIGIERHISDKFRDEAFADSEVCVVLASPSDQNAQLQDPCEAREELDRFPGHLLVLTRSPYFQTQVNFVRQQEEQRGRDSGMGRTKPRSRSRSREQRKCPQTDSHPLQRSTPSSSPSSSRKMTFVLAVDDRSHAPAATAVIASLYGVTSPTEGLQEEELVYRVQYADMLQVDSFAAEAVAQLKSAAALRQGLSAATMAALAALPSWPSCLLPLLPIIASHVTAAESAVVVAQAATEPKIASIQQVLVAALGNLEATWQSEELSTLLLKLNFPAVLLLLSSDQLQVCFEDTVLLTAVKYVQRQPTPSFKAMVRKQVSSLIRAPHLSDLQLAAQAFGSDNFSYLSKHRRQLQQLQQLRRIEAAHEDLPPDSITAWRSQVPSSWLQGARRHLHQPTDGVTLTWRVPISKLSSLVSKCQVYKDHQSLSCATLSPPLKGLQWQMWASCKWEDNSGVYLGIFYAPTGLPDDMYFKFRYSFESSVGIHVPTTSMAGAGSTGWGLRDFFGLGALKGGWDHQTWVAKGLPSDGIIELKLTVYDVW